jgi:predicted lipoprotein with Yx(FWY)xxD motif
MSVALPTRFLVVAAAASFAAAALAVSGVAAAHGASAGAAANGKPVVELRTTAFGKVLVDARGHSLYLFTPDKGKTSVCYGKCAAAWPPLLVRGTPAGGKGIKRGLLGVTMRKDGSHQLTYAGHPLYRFAGDSRPGQTNGQGLQKIWWVVSPAGRKVTRRPPVRRAAAATVQLRKTSVGTVLVDAQGRTLYLYAPDKSGSSTCSGGCAASWPPLLVKGAPKAGNGAKAALLGTTERSDGSLQVTYDGHPLYRFGGDSKAGDVNGQGAGGIWYVLDAAGHEIDDDSGATSSGNGYGG